MNIEKSLLTLTRILNEKNKEIERGLANYFKGGKKGYN
jgi:hypothetical protein